MGTLKGRQGEERACGYLLSQKYELLKRNFRSPRGEVDIIARKGESLVFVEVKSWDVSSLHNLEISLGRGKIERIVRTAEHFLASRPDLQDCSVRFDVIFLSQDGEKLEHFPDAFTESGFS